MLERGLTVLRRGGLRLHGANHPPALSSLRSLCIHRNHGEQMGINHQGLSVAPRRTRTSSIHRRTEGRGWLLVSRVRGALRRELPNKQSCARPPAQRSISVGLQQREQTWLYHSAWSMNAAPKESLINE